MSKHNIRRIETQQPPVAVQEPPPLVNDIVSGEPAASPLAAAVNACQMTERQLRDAVTMLDRLKRQRDQQRDELERLSRPEHPDRRHWPADEPFPSVYVKRVTPCPKCRRVLTDDGGRSAVVTSSASDIAWFRCRTCGHRWQLPVKRG